MAKVKLRKTIRYVLVGIVSLYMLAVLDSDTLWLKSDGGYRVHVLENRPEGESKGAIIFMPEVRGTGSVL